MISGALLISLYVSSRIKEATIWLYKRKIWHRERLDWKNEERV